MRLLHTSDWHLGRYLRTVPLIDEQRAFLDWLAELAAEQHVDAVLVSGDVFDRAIPSVEAVPLLEQGLVNLVRTCPVILISGNHDSATRLGFGGSLLERAGVHLRADVDDIDRAIEIAGADGSRALVYGIPYLEPEVVRGPLNAEKSHEAVLTAAMDRIRADIEDRSARAPSRAARSATDRPAVVVLAHAFITGGTASDSERDISVGGINDAPAGLFHGVDYVALGHLHGPQSISSAGPVIRYSGSPLPYSFSEQDQSKSVTIVDLGPDGSVDIELIPAPTPRSMRTITGDVEDLLTDVTLADAEGAWIRAIVTDTRRPESAMERLRGRFPFTIELSWVPHLDGVPIVLDDQHADPRSEDPVEVVSSFIAHVTGVAATPEQVQLVTASVERIRIRETSA